MNKLKKASIVAAIVCLSLCIILSGCGKKGSQEDNSDESSTVTVSPSPTPPSATPTPPQSPEVQKNLIGTIVNAENGVNIRSGPSTESEVLTIAELGRQFKVLKEYYTSEWHKIEYEDGVAYINAGYLEITEVPATTDTAN